ncbi:MAG TPA: hypothetical protein EYP49_00050, partial [Anaerolineae bacterium]|nr:hypothetical protein [Anaerolineae bacterium]
LNPQVMNLGDWVFPNVHPYWHGITDPSQAVAWTEERFRELDAQTDKLVVFKEVGLPTGGDDQVNEAKQAEYYRLLQDTSVAFVYFEAFDQPWKDWAPVEPHWGLFRRDRSPKPVVQYVCRAPSPPSRPYGLVQDLTYDPPEDLDAIVDLMARAGVQHVRMDFRWYLIEPENDVWDFELHDRIVQTLENRGIEIVGLLDDVPTWANGQSGPRSGTYPPNNVEDWSDYVFHVVNHYKGRVTCWELWHEENIAQYFRPRPDANRYVQMLRAGYEAAKRADPDAVVLLGSLAGNGVNMGWEPPESRNFLQKIYDSGGKGYFDVVGIHPYVHPITSTHGLPAGIEGLRDAVEATRSVMLANGDDKPIWITEIGWSTAPDAWGQPTVSEIEVANWLKAVYMGRSDLGVEKIFWYNFRDSGPDRTNVEHNFGLVRHDLIPKPAYWQYKALAAPGPDDWGGLPPIREGEFVTREGSKLMLGGREFRFVGNNAYFLQPEMAYGNLAGVEEVLDEMVALGMPVVRTIGFNDHDPAQDPAAIQIGPGVYNKQNLAALDRVIAEAKARRIRLVLYLTNNWDAYGGINRYIQWYEQQCNCEASHNDFYTNETMKGWYKDYVGMLLNRTNTITGIKYKDEPAILAWELGNELRNEGGDATALLDWVEEMAAYIKSIDPNHLIADGGEGFDDDSSLYPGLSNDYAVRGDTGNSYHHLVTRPHIDMVSYHLYPSKWGLNETTDVEIWIQVHEQLAQDAGKVAYMGEYGTAGPDGRRAEVFDRWLKYSVVDYRSTGNLLWQMAYDARPDYDGFTVYYPGDTQTNPVLRKFATMTISPSANAYSHLYAVMDKYATGEALRLLESYEDTDAFNDGDTAWVYDNALVMLALMARGAEEDWARAKVLADSLVYAQNHDPDFTDGRLRDAYHASAFIGQDGEAQVAAPGSGVGNMAFATLALLRYWEAKEGDSYLEAATRLGQWIYDHTYDTHGPGGYTGGYVGNPPDQTRHRWKATEHNIDVYAAFMKLYEATGDSTWLRRAMHAKNFVKALWNEAGGHFWTGTLNDGASINPSPIPEDAQSWGLMALGEVSRYGAGITWAEDSLLVDPCPGCEACKGFRFSDRGAGCWWEGTAHMVIALQIKGESDKADQFLAALRKVQISVPNNNGKGIVSACPGGADSGYGGIYPNALHIGAAAWYLFAERGHNPFWGVGTGDAIPYDGLYDAFLETLARDTWRYLSSDWATDNHLPWSWRSNRITGGDYANPTEIGLYMLSYIGAYELQKDWSPSWEEVEAEVGATLDQLEAWQSGTQAYQPHGPNAYNNSVFYQAYWINWNPPVVGAGEYDHQVPSIDNAWLAASLITIREYAEANGKTTLAQKADGVLKDMDFTLWYHPQEHRFTWGAPDDPQGGGLADYYSNENRIINFVARALGQLNEEEFQASLAALEQSPGTYNRSTPDPADDITVGKVNWDGSYSTYTTPAVFIREMETTYGRGTINKATEAQIAYAQDQGYPVWGISDAFDVEDGGYVERGAPPRGSGNPLEDVDNGLITPHASALALITGHAHEAISNLQALRDLDPELYDANYGLKDSVNVNSSKVSYRFSALAQEWIFLSLTNYLGDGAIWRYFYRDEGVKRAHAEISANRVRLHLPVLYAE